MSKVQGIIGYVETQIPTDWVTAASGDVSEDNIVAIRCAADGEIEVLCKGDGAVAITFNMVAGEVIPAHVAKVVTITSGNFQLAKG